MLGLIDNLIKQIMKNFYIALTILLGSTIAPQQVQAAVITYDFTATVHDVRHITGPWDSYSIFSSEGPNGGPIVAVGQKIAGRFSYDDAQPSDWSTSESWGSGFSHYSNGALSYTFLSSNTTFVSSGALSSWHPAAPDQSDTFHIYGDDPFSSFNFEDSSKTLFAAGVPKGTLALESLSKADFGASWKRPDDALISFRSHIDTLTLATPTLAEVPEPGSWGLMLAGLAAFGAAVRRKRS
jgi:hypothetical protein